MKSTPVTPVAPVYMTHLGIVCSLGSDQDLIKERLSSGNSHCLTYSNQYSTATLPLGVVNSTLPLLAELPEHHRTRCNQLMIAAVSQIKEDFENARKNIDPLRIGIVLGTSTGGLAEGEDTTHALYNDKVALNQGDYPKQEVSSSVECLADYLQVKGPAYTISTACSSSAKSLASARRLLRMGICDLVIAGGVDSLCKLTVNGFDSLESISNKPCQPFSQSRDGINIGEGAAFFLMSKEQGPVCLSGVGENSDAHHISAPEPSGSGASAAMIGALQDASITPEEIDYINVHGTATQQNDKMESLAVHTLFGNKTPVSSTKPYTGHCLGAAGAVEAGICWLMLTQSANLISLPVHLWDGQQDPEISPLNLVPHHSSIKKIDYALSNSFAFGGNNITLILGRAH